MPAAPLFWGGVVFMPVLKVHGSVKRVWGSPIVLGLCWGCFGVGGLEGGMGCEHTLRLWVTGNRRDPQSLLSSLLAAFGCAVWCIVCCVACTKSVVCCCWRLLQCTCTGPSHPLPACHCHTYPLLVVSTPIVQARRDKPFAHKHALFCAFFVPWPGVLDSPVC